MSEIIIPESAKPENDQNGLGEITYEATEDDEERFFLMYHMSVQPSEAEALKPDYRKWIIARFIAQKSIEREAMERHRLMSQIGPNLKV